MSRDKDAKILLPRMRTIPALLIMLGAVCGGASAQESPDAEATVQDLTNTDGSTSSNLKLAGFIRTWMSWNLKDNQDVTAPYPGQPPYSPLEGKGDMSMFRTSLQLEADYKTGPVSWHGVARADREKLTSYGKRLQERSCTSATVIGAPTGPGCDVRQQYNQIELRELYVDFPVGDRISVRFGKQQVVFGETDFFHPNDLLNGFDYRWRLFGEPESDALRKPVIMANVQIAVPEADGSLQVVVRPGWDRNRDIGNTYDIYGGRWMASPNMGVDYLAYASQFNYDHPAGRQKDVTGAIRWSGKAGGANYAFSYQRVFQPDFVLNPCGVFAGAADRDATGCVSNLYYRQAPVNKAYGDWIYPVINVFGASVSAESETLDAILNAEVAYQKGRLFNSNSNVSGTPNALGYFQTPNNAGVMGRLVEKDVVQTTLRADKQLRLQSWFGTNAPSFASVQIFDTWVQSFDPADDAIVAVGGAARLRKHNTIGTAFVQFPYMNSRLVYQIAVGTEFQGHNSFLIPSVSFNIGNHWRINADAVLFHSRKARTNNISDPGYDSMGFAALNDHDYATLRVTYQF
ncbi:LysR family transcriptional regulator [Telluria mixta]|uniref:LysR family transcriptional regulator n=1 Tax=Telluria mixta TaxID=34071 RepID=A0ABT2C1H4_9BURK|nr:DUF1302 family protein [Telluria mixta]MCS0631237.1 LysR family transcriptional regulator [Telluria mixta]WEM95777.1 LysR family transcriptional regulator [Telluria mixta]